MRNVKLKSIFFVLLGVGVTVAKIFAKEISPYLFTMHRHNYLQYITMSSTHFYKFPPKSSLHFVQVELHYR